MVNVEKTVMLFVINEGKILLSRRLNTWYGENQFAPPGGLVDSNEIPAEAAVRETFEETGIKVSTERLRLLTTRNSEMNERFFESYYFYTNSFTGELKNKEPHRHSELDWYSLNNLPPETMPIVLDILSII